MPASSYRIHIVRDGVEFEAEGDKKFVLDMLARFETGRPATPLPPAPAARSSQSSAPKTAGSSKDVSVGEYVRQLGFKKHTDLVLAFGYYLEHMRGTREFTPADINNCYYEAKMENSNTSQMIVQNIRRGYLMQAKQTKGSAGKKRYAVTQSGEDFIKGRFAKQRG